MSVNLKGRKNAQSEQVVPAPELVMAGGQTPWATDAPPPAGNPFAEAGAPAGMPAMPPPPPGEEGLADPAAPSGRKAPSRNMILGLVAVLALAGGGYYYTTMSSSSTPVVPPHRVVGGVKPGAVTPAKPGAAAVKPGAAAVKPGAVTPAKGGTHVVKPPVKPATHAKGGTPVKPPTSGKPAAAAKPATPAAVKPVAPVPAGTPFTAALPGRIGEWSKLVSSKIPDTLAKYDPDLGTTPSNVQHGIYGDQDNIFLSIVTGDHSPNASKTALQLLTTLIPYLQEQGFVVERPFAVPHSPYSGTAACTSLTMDDVLGVACVWTDSDTFGVITAPNRADSNASSILDMVRGSVEH